MNVVTRGMGQRSSLVTRGYGHTLKRLGVAICTFSRSVVNRLFSRDEQKTIFKRGC